MENYNTIMEQINAVKAEAAAIKKQIDSIVDGIREESDLKKRVDARRNVSDVLADLDAKQKDCVLKERVLCESFRASFAAYVWENLKPILEKYAGKQYGEKTKEQISAAAREKGFKFYFDGYKKSDYIKAFPDSELCHYYGPALDVELWAVDDEGKFRSEFIDESNKIAATLPNVKSHYKYIDDVEGHIDAIKAAYNEYTAAAEALNKAADTLRDLYPHRGGYDRYYPANLI